MLFVLSRLLYDVPFRLCLFDFPDSWATFNYLSGFCLRVMACNHMYYVSFFMFIFWCWLVVLFWICFYVYFIAAFFPDCFQLFRRFSVLFASGCPVFFPDFLDARCSGGGGGAKTLIQFIKIRYQFATTLGVPQDNTTLQLRFQQRVDVLTRATLTGLGIVSGHSFGIFFCCLVPDCLENLWCSNLF